VGAVCYLGVVGLGVPLVYRCAKQHSEPASDKRAPAHYLWAVLSARVYEVFPLLCPLCGGEMRLIAFIAEGMQIRRTTYGIRLIATNLDCISRRSASLVLMSL
jgi:hypothetical protein